MVSGKNFLLSPNTGGSTEPPVLPLKMSLEGERFKWNTLTFDYVSDVSYGELGTPNPFKDVMYLIEFLSPSNKTYKVFGYFAADGNSANTGNFTGKIFRAHFTPNEIGKWMFRYVFVQSTDINLYTFEDFPFIIPFSYSFEVGSKALFASDLRTLGVAIPDKGYLTFENGKRFIKVGVDSPENLLAYYAFDNTSKKGGSGNDLTGTSSYTVDGVKYNYKGDGLHHYEPHLQHWKDGDPTFANGHGKELIGLINYLADQGMNSISFLTMNINGDGQDVHPYVNYNGGNAVQEDRLRFDVSKLDQWKVIFDHAQSRGMHLHFKLQETENDGLLDNGDLGAERKLYYKQMVSRFGHYLLKNFNLSEEFSAGSGGDSGSGTQRVKDYCTYIRDISTFPPHIVLHTYGGQQEQYYGPQVGLETLSGVSIQTDPNNVHAETLKWVQRSKASGLPWVVANDEQGPANKGLAVNGDQANLELFTHKVLWGNLLAGGAGVEYYFGYGQPHNDLDCEAMQVRSDMWAVSKIAKEFFEFYLPVSEMENMDHLTTNSDVYCFGKDKETYVLYVPSNTSSFTFSGSPGVYDLLILNPYTGEKQTQANVVVNPTETLSNPDSQDRVILLEFVSELDGGGTGAGGSDPYVYFEYPVDGSVVQAGSQVPIRAEIVNSTDISKVEFRLNGNLIQTERQHPYDANISSVASGTHTILATVYNSVNQAYLTSSISITAETPTGVPNPPSQVDDPFFNFYKPTETVVPVNSSVLFAVNAVNFPENIATVEYFLNGNKVKTERVHEYEYTGVLSKLGLNTIVVTATGVNGFVRTSQPLYILTY